MSLLIPLIIVIPLLAFWLWMFWDMLNNEAIPSSAVVQFRWPPVTKTEWTFAFVFLNVFAATYYYLIEYR